MNQSVHVNEKKFPWNANLKWKAFDIISFYRAQTKWIYNFQNCKKKEWKLVLRQQQPLLTVYTVNQGLPKTKQKKKQESTVAIKSSGASTNTKLFIRVGVGKSTQ